MSNYVNKVQMSEEKQVGECVDNQDLEQLVVLISNGSISSIGIKTAYFDKDTTFFMHHVQFDLADGALAKPRIQDDCLVLDLWFHAHNPKLAQGVLQERSRFHREGIQYDVLLTVVVSQLDYVSTYSERYYW